jgi:hypothetical protein
MLGSSWMIKANDYAEFPANFGNWAYVMCGTTADYGSESTPTQPFSTSDDPCEPGQVQTFTSYYALRNALTAGTTSSTVVFDPETWNLTPADEQAAQSYYIKLGCQDASSHNVKVIVTPEGTPGTQLNDEYTTGAQYCSVVEDQSQGHEDSLSSFQSNVSSFLGVVDAVHDHAQPMLGLATDPGGRETTVADLTADYNWAHARGVDLWWMNADAWTGKSDSHTGYFDGTGDASVAESFLGG